MLAVAVVEEGMELRGAAIATPILVMGWIGPEQLDALVIHGLTPNAHSPEQLKELIDFAESMDVTLPVHLKLDTGMTRLGILPQQLSDSMEMLRQAEGRIFLEGVFQNFASADEADVRADRGAAEELRRDARGNPRGGAFADDDPHGQQRRDARGPHRIFRERPLRDDPCPARPRLVRPGPGSFLSQKRSRTSCRSSRSSTR